MAHYSYGDIAVLGQQRCQGDSLRRAQSLFCILTGWTLGSAGSSPAVSPCVSGAFATSQLGWLCSFFPCVSKSLRLRQTACGLMLHDCVLFHRFYFGTEARGKCWCTGAWPWQMKQGIQELGCALGQGDLPGRQWCIRSSRRMGPGRQAGQLASAAWERHLKISGISGWLLDKLMILKYPQNSHLRTPWSHLSSRKGHCVLLFIWRLVLR